MSFLQKVIQSGVSYTDTTSEKRNVVLTNQISLLAACATLMLLPGRYFFAYVHLSVVFTLLQGATLFLLPIMLNRFGFVNLSRVGLCWLPSLFQLYAALRTFSEVEQFEASTYVGLRFFLLAFSCFPFLVFDLRNKFLLVVGVTGPTLSLLVYDPLLNFFGVGYRQSGLDDPTYDFNNVRAFFSFIMIGASSYFLKRLIEKNESLNDQLIRELAEKNRVIRQQASEELYQMNQQLHANLQQLREREFILNQSQRIAKVGSWEYRIAGNSLFWSEEMYNIFGLDKHFDLKAKKLEQILWGGQSELLIGATNILLRTGEPYDLMLRTTTPLGYNKWVRIYGFPIDENNTIIGAHGICHDITFYKEAEEQLRSSEEKFSKIFESNPDLITIVRESDGILVDANKKIEDVSGYTREEVLGLSATRDGFKIWSNAAEREAFHNEYNTHGRVFKEIRLLRKNGDIFYATASAQRIVLSNQNHMIVVIRDITEQKEYQEKLMLSQANLNATINNTEIMIWSVDRDFNLITYNKPFAGYVKELYGIEVKHGSRIFLNSGSPEADAMTKKWTQHYLRTLAGEIVTLEETRHGRDFYYSLSPIIEEDKIIGVSVFAENVTERKVRDRELAEANKKIGELKLMALRSMMNPHFVFNVLNSIQYFIAKNDRLNAINYLSTFSKLIRSILTHSVNNKIKLTDELEMLKNYIHLEMTRFENKFNFILKVDPDVDTDAIEIPSLLIQPYVENAILHGLYNKQGNGTLKIHVREKKDCLYVEIEDDGIGREAARKLRKGIFSDHKSMGIELTEERLRLINEQHNVVFETQDLVNENGPCGTRVRIGINL